MLDVTEEMFLPLMDERGMLPARAGFEVDYFPHVWFLVYVRLRRGWRLVLDPFGCYWQDGKAAFHLAKPVALARLCPLDERLEGQSLIVGRKESEERWRWQTFPYRPLSSKEIRYWSRGIKQFSQVFVTCRFSPGPRASKQALEDLPDRFGRLLGRFYS